ncbi:capsular polysaccharide export protein, LipB/KpsS family [Roseimaritima ulvae]|nr:hypothetical protein [Roseimaritima ulvae]
MAPDINAIRTRGQADKLDEDETIDVVAPQANEGFFPPLLARNEHHLTGSRNGMVSIRLAYLSLYLGLSELGVRFNQVNADNADVVLNWSYKMSHGDNSQRIYLEHGWLPRTSYQISPDGTNALSHVAKAYRFEPLEDQHKETINKILHQLKERMSISNNQRAIDMLRSQHGEPFILFALQLANDANLRYSGSNFAEFFGTSEGATKNLVQACVEESKAWTLPYRIIFRQHPLDTNDYTALATDLGVTFMDPKTTLRTSEIFESGLCKAVVAINSNTLHEACLWKIPVISLGTLIWNESCKMRPFPRDPSSLVCNNATDLTMSTYSYLRWILSNQWSLNDFLNPKKLKELITSRGRCCPHNLYSCTGTSSS